MLFIQFAIGLSTTQNLSTVILRSDLGGKNARYIIQKTFSNQMLFYIDINELKLYIMDNGLLSVYDYHGKFVESISSPKSINNFVVFNQTLYTYNNTRDKSYAILSYNLTDMKYNESSASSIAVRLRGVSIIFIL